MEIKFFVKNRLKHFCDKILFSDEEGTNLENFVNVNILGRMHSREGLAKVCKKVIIYIFYEFFSSINFFKKFSFVYPAMKLLLQILLLN